MPKFNMSVLINPYVASDTARLGAGTGAGNYLSDADVGKFVKFAGDSRYDLAVAGDKIEGQIESVEVATQDNYTIGAVKKTGRINVVLDGLQATPGTGAIAIGDYVLVGTVVAKGTALAAAPKVTKATDQTIAANSPFAWRLVSASGTAVGSTGVIERA